MSIWYEHIDAGLMDLQKCTQINCMGDNFILFHYLNAHPIHLCYMDQVTRELEFNYIKLLLGISD
jgi:hypothetical protein